MSNKSQTQSFAAAPVQSWDLFRLSKSKEIVDLVPNTLRQYNEQGLPFYRHGRAVFVSRTELDSFIRDPQSFARAKAA